MHYTFYKCFTYYYKTIYSSFTDFDHMHIILDSDEFTREDDNYYKEILIFGKTDRK